jgi:hypothetical protein
MKVSKRSLNFVLFILALFIEFGCRPILKISHSFPSQMDTEFFQIDGFVFKKDLILGTNNELLSPVAVEVNAQDDIYILDKGNNCIQIYSKNGDFIKTVFNIRKATKNPPILDIALNRAGNLFFIDYDRTADRAWMNVIFPETDGSKSFEISLLPGEIITTNNQIYISDVSYQNDFLLYAYSEDGKLLEGFNPVNKKEDLQERIINNKKRERGNDILLLLTLTGSGEYLYS